MAECGLNSQAKANECARLAQRQPLQNQPPPRPEKKVEESKIDPDIFTDRVEIKGFDEEGGVLDPASLPYATSVVYVTQSVRAPKLGLALQDKVEKWKEAYKKACQQLRGSPNLMISLYHAAKVAYYGSRLFMEGGFSFPELQDLRREALSELYGQNKQLSAENERNYVLVRIMGGKKKKGELRVIAEIRNQLTLQAKRLGKPYSELDIHEMQLEQANAILAKFKEEIVNLKTQKELLEAYAYGKA
ncbi:hypothetical protein AMJ44_04420 [candidate division WOR-1 bacterium DG_54_3]|uniref:Uncharacterized protein n=1 Tax=candidate division WOR-1 bacterium DG_54_3 TaxID=1703775 RepID=A0A0S7Y358_UNCSA|nr:MAG: hypothetical protein AMJ44_04420 [candidate division WOR-1 bacterium DG_54_3]